MDYDLSYNPIIHDFVNFLESNQLWLNFIENTTTII